MLAAFSPEHLAAIEENVSDFRTFALRRGNNLYV
jgi:hypothetical protein